MAPVFQLLGPPTIPVQFIPAELCLVVSNHETLRPVAERFDLPFVHVPVQRDH